MNWTTPEIRSLVQTALREDCAHTDLTTISLIKPRWKATAVIVANETGVICGLPLAALFFRVLDPKVRFKALVKEGAHVRTGRRLALIKGRARTILSAERPALNTLQHLSGISTFTAKQVAQLQKTGVRLFDTRKTLPGWRRLQKYAVKCGGAFNHRMSLHDAIMVKENHLQVVRSAVGSSLGPLESLFKRRSRTEAQMEIQSERDLKDAIALKVPRVLLDNMSVPKLRRMIKALRRKRPEVEIEITGGVRPENLKKLAALQPDRISMGRLTHSVMNFDCGLDITHVYS